MMFLQGFVSSAHLDSKALSLIKFIFGPCKRRRRPSKVYALSMSHSFTLMDLKRIEYVQNSQMFILHSTCGLFSTSESVSTVSRQQKQY